MGPFYIEGSEYGDALEVKLDKVRLNRNWGYTSYRLSPGVLNSGENLYPNVYKMDALRPQAGRPDPMGSRPGARCSESASPAKDPDSSSIFR